MRRELARFTEWSWLQGRVTDKASIEALSADFHAWLAARFPQGAGLRSLALAEIERDVARSLRALTYGGRKRDAVPAPRQTFLSHEALRLGWR